VKLLVKFVKQERSHFNLVGSGHRKAYQTAELASNFPGVFRRRDQVRPASQDRARIVFDCRITDDPAMMSSTNSAHVYVLTEQFRRIVIRPFFQLWNTLGHQEPLN
jgi:hypothetical protein